MVIYTNKFTTISKLQIPIKNIIDAINQTNSWLKLLDIEWKILSKTLISSIITEIYPFHLCRNNILLMVNPLEKSYPDIIHSQSSKDDIKNKKCVGLEVKFSNCDAWSAHHTFNTSILAGSWRYKDDIPQILALFYADNLSSRDWHKKPNVENNRNTPSCSLKPNKLTCICYNTDFKSEKFKNKNSALSSFISPRTIKQELLPLASDASAYVSAPSFQEAGPFLLADYHCRKYFKSC